MVEPLTNETDERDSTKSTTTEVVMAETVVEAALVVVVEEDADAVAVEVVQAGLTMVLLGQAAWVVLAIQAGVGVAADLLYVLQTLYICFLTRISADSSTFAFTTTTPSSFQDANTKRITFQVKVEDSATEASSFRKSTFLFARITSLVKVAFSLSFKASTTKKGCTLAFEV